MPLKKRKKKKRLSYKGIQAVSQVYPRCIDTFLFKKKKKKDLDMYLRGIQYDTGTLCIGYGYARKN